MMNILEQSEALKSIPEDALMREMQQPTGSMPQFLVLTELKRRKRMRDEYNRRKAQDIPTVAEEVVMGAGMPQEGIMQMSKSMAPKSSIAQNTGQQEAAPKEPTMGMASGGLLSLAKGDKLGKPVVYNGDTYMVDDRGQVYFNRRRVANRKLRDAVLQKAASDAAGDVDDSPTPQAQTGSQLLDQAQTALTGQQMFSPSGIPSVSDGINRPPISGFPAPEGSVDLPVFDATAPDYVTKRGMPEGFSGDPRLQGGILDHMRGTGIPAAAQGQTGSALPRPESGDIAAIAAMAQDQREKYSDDFLNPQILEMGTGATPLASNTFDTQPSVARENQISGENRLLDALTRDRSSTPEEISSESSDPIDFSNITAYPPTLSPMEIAARRNIAEQEATLPQRPLNIDATPPGFVQPSSIFDTQPSVARESQISGENIFSDALTDERLAAQREAKSRDLTRILMNNQQSYEDAAFSPETPSRTAMRLSENKDTSAAPKTERQKKAESLIRPEDSGPLFPDGTADAGTTDTSLPITGDPDPDITFDLPKPQEERPNITLDPNTSKGDPDAINRITPAKPSGPSRTTGGTGGTGGSPLRSRIEQLIADREKDREADKWMAIAETGLALMASSNPTLGGAIGEAGLVGVGTMRKAKQDYDKDMLELLTIQEDMRQADLDYSASLAAAAARGSGDEYKTSQRVDDLRAMYSLEGKALEALSSQLAALSDPSDVRPDDVKAAEAARLRKMIDDKTREVLSYQTRLKQAISGRVNLSD